MGRNLAFGVTIVFSPRSFLCIQRTTKAESADVLVAGYINVQNHAVASFFLRQLT
jgi:hypothetical protein